MENGKTKIVEVVEKVTNDFNQADLTPPEILTATAVILTNIIESCSSHYDGENDVYERLKAITEILLKTK